MVLKSCVSGAYFQEFERRSIRVPGSRFGGLASGSSLQRHIITITQAAGFKG